MTFSLPEIISSLPPPRLLHSCQSSSILQKIQIYLLIYSYKTKNYIHQQGEELYKPI